MRYLMPILRVVWISSCVAVVVWWIFRVGMDGSPSEARSWRSFYAVNAMVGLSFPTGLVWYLLVAVVLLLLSASGVDVDGLTVSAVFDFVFILSIALAGYFQWFVFVPWLVRRIRAHRCSPGEEGVGRS